MDTKYWVEKVVSVQTQCPSQCLGIILRRGVTPSYSDTGWGVL